jgi:uncharacterized protein (DUF1697 family)
MSSMATHSYAALLRGVSPMNAKMPALQRCFEAAGFTGVKTVLSSGNVVFGARRATTPAVLARRLEAAMTEALDRSFLTIVRPIDELRALLAYDPYRKFDLPAGAKRVVTFLRDVPRGELALPIELHDARILCRTGCEVFSAYVPGPRGPVFMTLIEKSLGTELTTRTWETVGKIVRAAELVERAPASRRARR